MRPAPVVSDGRGSDFLSDFCVKSWLRGGLFGGILQILGRPESPSRAAARRVDYRRAGVVLSTPAPSFLLPVDLVCVIMRIGTTDFFCLLGVRFYAV